MKRAIIVTFMLLWLSTAAVDWTGVQPLVTDSAGDQLEDLADIQAVYVQMDDTYLHIRAEMGDANMKNDDMLEFRFDTDLDWQPDFSTNFYLNDRLVLFRYGEQLQRLPTGNATLSHQGRNIDIAIPLVLLDEPARMNIALSLWSRTLISNDTEVVDELSPAWYLFPSGSIEQWSGHDWTGVEQLGDLDPEGDALGTSDIRALYVTNDTEHLYLRLDIDGITAPEDVVIEFLLDTDFDDVIDFSTNLHTMGPLYLFKHEPEFIQLPPGTLALATVDKGYQVRIPLAAIGNPRAMLIGVGQWGSTDLGPFLLDEMPFYERSYPPGAVSRWGGHDWTGIPPLAVDPRNDSPESTDLKSLYMVNDTTYVYLRVDHYTTRINPGDLYEFLFDIDMDTKPDYSTNFYPSGSKSLFKEKPTLTRVDALDSEVTYHDNVFEARVPLTAIGSPAAMRIGVTVTSIAEANRTMGKEPSDILLQHGFDIVKNVPVTETDYLYIVYLLVIIGLLAFIAQDIMTEERKPSPKKKKKKKKKKKDKDEPAEEKDKKAKPKKKKKKSTPKADTEKKKVGTRVEEA
ncbi:MAG: hypothetical protein QF415_08680 [Candidatus Undinarchaeales archaeon]|jgi:hypothetical protein|nr:hypothetical protein [Candidatus Undinarchaeales archaeon]MDP7494137.1 hypothetical protein [Candidatus Undinarchaeales archaeon]